MKVGFTRKGERKNKREKVKFSQKRIFEETFFLDLETYSNERERDGRESDQK